MNNTEEKMSRLKRHQMTKQTGHDDRITKLTKEYEALSAERATIQRKIDENNAKMAATDDKVGISFIFILEVYDDSLTFSRDR